MSWVFWNFLCVFIIHSVSSDVFLRSHDASQVLIRRRRANSIFEELKKGNMERECVEERCSYEEAREIFENAEKTTEFWNVYFDGDACASHPCLNGAVCKDGIGLYTCYCAAGFKGQSCEIAIPELCESENGGCDHFCSVKQKNVVCSCAKGYTLASNEKSCQSDDLFRCGYVHPSNTRSIFIYEPNNTNTKDPQVVTGHFGNATVDKMDLFGLNEDVTIENPVEEEAILPESSGKTRIVNGVDCPPGECPWQALLINEKKIGFCGGTIINEFFILSAAHCMNHTFSTQVVVGEFDTLVDEGKEAIHDIDKILMHFHYAPETYNNDIALIKVKEPIKFSRYIIPACLPQPDFAERVLMRQDEGMISGFGRVREGGLTSTILQRLTVPYVDRATCLESSQFKITTNMFCAGYDQEAKDACQGDSGGPHVTRYKDTWFITGVVSWGEGCAREGKYGVYTQVSKYIKWIQNTMRKFMPRKETSVKPKAKRSVTRYV